MCIAILAQAGSVVTQERIKGSFENNSDGAGLAYVDKDSGNVCIRKGFFTPEDFLKTYYKVIEEGHALKHPMLLHFRIATAGRVDTDNCHPFMLKEGAMIHNGSFFGGSLRDEKSDTRLVAEGVFDKFTYDRMKDNVAALSNAARSNRVAVLFNGGKYIILNEHYGHWDKGVWYSNRSYMPWNFRGTDLDAY